MDNVSVIIRSKNEQDHVGFAIQSCLDYLKDPQIIVVDNESTDDTLGVVNLFVDRADIKIVSIEKDQYTPGRSINMGVREADQDTCLVLSAHCQIRERPLPVGRPHLHLLCRARGHGAAVAGLRPRPGLYADHGAR